MKFTLTSSAFKHNQDMPKKYTCQGENISPPLEWSNVPAGTKSLVLIIEDPDAPDPAAPKTVWDHFIMYNISPATNAIKEDRDAAKLGAQPGVNSWKKTAYGGPCPPIGKHRYFHKLLALDLVLDDLRHPTKDKLLEAIKGHVLGEAELIGLYQKQT